MRFGLAANIALVCAIAAPAGAMASVRVERPDRERMREQGPPPRFGYGSNVSAYDLMRFSQKNARRKRRR